METESKITILGAGNIGLSIAMGLIDYGRIKPENIILTRRRINLLSNLRESGFSITDDNIKAVQDSDIIIIAVEPHQTNQLLEEIREVLVAGKHTLISVVTGINVCQIKEIIGRDIMVARAIPNIAVAVGESITCIASDVNGDKALEIAEFLFGSLGDTLIVKEEEMIASTAIGACGIAFFLRAIRAASQGGIEVGLKADQALKIVTQAAKGAATLLIAADKHPEQLIDRVTTPKGCTISGLNLMEHEGFSSAMIKGISLSAEKAQKLYKGRDC